MGYFSIFVINIFAIDKKLTGNFYIYGAVMKPVKSPEQGSLSASRGSNDTGDAFIRYCQIDVFKNMIILNVEVQVFNFNMWSKAT